ncbi:MAG: translocation and assembly module TamB [Glaciecola sp.]|jgi:translocation and assembly module TamB
MSNSTILNRTIKIASWSLLGAALLIMFILSVALSSIGTQWAINYVNEGEFGVEIEYKSGSFYSQVELNQIRVKQPGVDVELNDLFLDVGLSCLFAAEMCINKVRLNSVIVALDDTPAQEELVEVTESKLTELPFLLRLSDLSIGEIVVSKYNVDVLKLKDLLLALSFHKQLDISQLNASSLSIQLPKVLESELTQTVVNSGSKTRPREWLSALANYQYKPIEIPEVYIPIELTLNNAMLRNICLRQQAQDDLITTIFCNDSLAIGLNIQNQKLNTTIVIGNLQQGGESPYFIPTNLKLKTAINFAKKFEHNLMLIALKVDTPISSNSSKALKLDTPVFNNSTGFEFTSQGNINKLNLTLTHLHTQQKVLKVTSALELSKPTLPLNVDIKFEELSATVADDLQNWFPALSNDVISQLRGVSLLETNIDGDMQSYRLTSMLKMQEVMGVENFELNALFKPMSKKQGVRSLLDIQKLNINGSIGTLDYVGKAILAHESDGQNELSFNGNLKLESVQLGKLDVSLKSLISGELPHSIVITEKSQSADIKGAKLSGTWQNLPLSMIADAELEKSGNIKVQSVRLIQGSNQINVQGNLFSKKALESIGQLGANFPDKKGKNVSSLDFLIDLNALSDIYPDVEGQIYAKGNLSGAIKTPKIVMQANTKELTAAGTSIENMLIDISVNMANKLASKAQISVSNLLFGGQNIRQLELQLSGDEIEQSLRLSIPQGEYMTEQFFKGQLNAENTSWSGKWLEGKLVSSLAELTLQDQPDLTLSLKPFSLFLARHCWEGRGDRLCTEDIKATEQQAKTKISLDYNVMNPGVATLLPNFDIETSDLNLSIDIDIDWQQKQGLYFAADVVSENATLVSNDNKVGIENIRATVKGAPDGIDSNFSFDSTEAGQFYVNSKLDLSSKPYQHQGSLTISDFAVSYFASFITEVQKLSGDINANIAFDGPLDKPSLEGLLSITDGAVVLKEYPLRLADYNQKVTFKGSKADFAGQFTLGQGKGSIDGDVDFTDALIVSTIVVGDELDIAYESYQFKISPDLKIKLSPDLLSVSGKVEVPYARVKIKSLPTSAKSPTQDIIVIDDKKVVKQGLLPLDINVNVLIDKAKKGEVKLDALDLKAELSGDLTVQIDTQNTRVNGIVQVLKGDYEAYSQVLQIRKGDITFSGQPDVPAFDIEAIRNPLNTKDKVIAGIRITGNALKPSVELFSEPSMEQARQLSYLISGADNFGAGGDGSDSNTLVNALVSFGVGRSENGIGSLGKKLGVKDLNLQTAGQGSDTQVQLSGQLAEGVKVTYGIGVFDSVSEVSIHYQLLPHLYIEAVNGAYNTLDLYYQITSKD